MNAEGFETKQSVKSQRRKGNEASFTSNQRALGSRNVDHKAPYSADVIVRPDTAWKKRLVFSKARKNPGAECGH